MTANEVVERIKKNLGIPWNEKTYRDTFKVGDPNTEVKGIATTFMATFDLIRRAHEAGLNFVVTHEPTFWNDADTVKDFASDKVYQVKTDFCLRNNMVVWRFHDHIHTRQPDLIWVGLARALGWREREGAPHQFTFQPTTLEALATGIQRHMAVRTLRVVGDRNAKVSSAAVGMGYSIPRMTPGVDVVIGGENPETGGVFDDTGYVLDAAFFGRNKGEIILGHETSEEPGMEDCANWLRTFVNEVPVKFLRAGEPFWSPKA